MAFAGCASRPINEGFWIGLQADYDRERAKDVLAKTLAKIKPWPKAPAHQDGGA